MGGWAWLDELLHVWTPKWSTGTKVPVLWVHPLPNVRSDVWHGTHPGMWDAIPVLHPESWCRLTRELFSAKNEQINQSSSQVKLSPRGKVKRSPGKPRCSEGTRMGCLWALSSHATTWGFITKDTMVWTFSYSNLVNCEGVKKSECERKMISQNIFFLIFHRILLWGSN